MLRCVNPLRKFMVWDREVRHGTATFRAFRSAMVDLVKEVRARSLNACMRSFLAHASMHGAWLVPLACLPPQRAATHQEHHLKGHVTAHEPTYVSDVVDGCIPRATVQQR